MKLFLIGLLIATSPVLWNLGFRKEVAESTLQQAAPIEEKRVIPTDLRDFEKNAHWMQFSTSTEFLVDLTKEADEEYAVFLDQFSFCYALAEIISSASLSKVEKQTAKQRLFDNYHETVGEDEFVKRAHQEAEMEVAVVLAEAILSRETRFKFTTEHSLQRYNFEKELFVSSGSMSVFRSPSGKSSFRKPLTLAIGLRSGAYDYHGMFNGLQMNRKDAESFRLKNPLDGGSRLSVVWTGKTQADFGKRLELSSWRFDHAQSQLDLNGLTGGAQAGSGFTLQLSYDTAPSLSGL